MLGDETQANSELRRRWKFREMKVIREFTEKSSGQEWRWEGREREQSGLKKFPLKS